MSSHASTASIEQLRELIGRCATSSAHIRAGVVEPQRSLLEGVPVVPINRLSISWKESMAKSPKGPPLLAVDGHITVRVNETHAITDAELDLQVLRGEAAQWQVRVPVLPADATLEVKPAPQDENRVAAIDSPVDKQNPIVTVRLK